MLQQNMKIGNFPAIVLILQLATAEKIKSVCQINETQNHTVVDCSSKFLGSNDRTKFYLWLPDMEKIEKSNKSATLILERNGLTTLDAFPVMNSITEISVKNNLLEKSHKGVFQNLSNLKRIDLSYNRFTGK